MDLILVETFPEDKVALIRLNNPQAYNALSPELLKQLTDALVDLDADDNVHVMVITGNEKVFSAGADIKFMSQASVPDLLKSGYIDLFDRMAALRKPVIAAVSGWCLGGGMELAMACDLIVASETAKFGQPEINLGLFPGAGGTQRLPRLVGKYLAMEIILNDRRLTAQEALQLGLVNKVAPVDTYLEEALQLAREIAARPPLTVQLAKECIRYAFEAPLSAGLQYERRVFYLLFATEDTREGLQAFLEKRTPEWKGR